MAQQRSQHKGSITISNRDTIKQACVNPPFEGKHKKPQDKASLAKRKKYWAQRNSNR